MGSSKTSKQRTPSQCKEWERDRRNKFNIAIAELGEAIKNKCDLANDKNIQVQMSKVAIVQKAILSIKELMEGNSKLKAEIIALQVELEGIKNELLKDRKDASTQICRGAKIKLASSKYNEILMIKKCKNNAFKEKITPVTKKRKIRNVSSITSPPNLSKILPKSVYQPSGGENAIVVVPAAPYIIPQRPLLFPTTPPTYVLLNPSVATVNKPPIVPIVNRTTTDITKTTMVNILPISAYSRPLSAIKNKKTKIDVAKKKNKVSKKSLTPKESKTLRETNNNSDSNIEKENDKVTTITEPKTDSLQEKSLVVTPNNLKKDKTEVINQQNAVNKDLKLTDISNINAVATNSKSCEIAIKSKTNNERNADMNSELSKVEKTIAPDKAKSNNILDTALCENTVDAGNARLELAEELLAASPTAAFLMSFPLVSGNRADSPAEDTHHLPKENKEKRPDSVSETTSYFAKTTSMPETEKPIIKNNFTTISSKIAANAAVHVTKTVESKTDPLVVKSSVCNIVNESPFLSLPMPTVMSTTCSLADTTFPIDFDCNVAKSLPNQSASFNANNNIFYKSDPLNSVKNAIYSTSSITSGHEYNSLGLYPCAVEKYSSKKADYSNVEDNLMKLGGSRLTYDIDLGWSHKGFDFVNCTTGTSTYSKDSILTTVSTPFTTSYNTFTDFHIPLVSTASKKETTSKVTPSFAESIASFYSQPSNPWADDGTFYSTCNNSSTRSFSGRQQNVLLPQSQTVALSKQVSSKQADGLGEAVGVKPIHAPPAQEKFTKKSPSKMHINWMTSETRTMHNYDSTHNDFKQHRTAYNQVETSGRKQDLSDGNYFPLSIYSNYSSQVSGEEFQVWPTARPAGTTEITIEQPPINLPTLVGDLALGPHDKKKHADLNNRISSQTDLQNCGNFLSVTQLMNRSSENMSSRYQSHIEHQNKTAGAKHNAHINTHYTVENNRKSSRTDNALSQPCYFTEPKTFHYENPNPYTKKATKSMDKGLKNQKHSYTAEALIRGGSCTQKPMENKFPDKFSEYGEQCGGVAQVSHFPPMLEYSHDSYNAPAFSGALYNSTTSSISNSFYTNFMQSGANFANNLTGSTFAGDYVDFNQTAAECGYPNQKYEEFKMKSNPPLFHEKAPNKSSRRESAKHKLDCKKEPTKKYQSKRSKVTEGEEWSDGNSFMWQNKAPLKRHGNPEEYPNYVGNQMGQYPTEIFNTQLGAGQHAAPPAPSFPPASRANFNLSTIFPEITMKVQ